MHKEIVKPKLIVICGPTGVGKTSVAIELAEKYKGEIIGADSMQIYKYMDIGTAKPTPSQQIQIPHYMIDIIDPDASFDAALYAKIAQKKTTDVHNRALTPFVVGGTGLYIKALVHGIFHSRPVDQNVISRLKKESAEFGSAFLHKKLNECDPLAANKIHPNDLFRIARALEFFEKTGEPISTSHKEHEFKDKPFNVKKIFLYSDRKQLYSRINQRVDEMINQGLVEEVQGLLGKGYKKDLKSMQSIGYKHITDYLNGSLSWDESIRTMKRDSRRYAKRQFTWFRGDPDVIWIESDKTKEIHRIIDNFLYTYD